MRFFRDRRAWRKAQRTHVFEHETSQPLIWSLDYACGCTRFRHGQAVSQPCNVHEARLGRWST